MTQVHEVNRAKGEKTRRKWTVIQLAIEFNLDRKTVLKRLEGVDADGTKGTAKEYLLTTAAPAILGFGTGGDAISETEARRRKLAAEALLAEYNLAEVSREMVAISIIEPALDRMFANARQRLLAIPSKVAPLVSPDAPADAHAEIMSAINEALEELQASAVLKGEPD